MTQLVHRDSHLGYRGAHAPATEYYVLTVPSRTCDSRYPKWARAEEYLDAPALRFALFELPRISRESLGVGGLSRATQDQVLRFLAHVADIHSPAVSIAPDEEGVAVLYWVAGDVALQVDIEETGPSYLWWSVGGEPEVVTDPARIFPLARAALAKIGQMAER